MKSNIKTIEDAKDFVNKYLSNKWDEVQYRTSTAYLTIIFKTESGYKSRNLIQYAQYQTFDLNSIIKYIFSMRKFINKEFTSYKN